MLVGRGWLLQCSPVPAAATPKQGTPHGDALGGLVHHWSTLWVSALSQVWYTQNTSPQQVRARGHASEFPRSRQSQTTPIKKSPRGSTAARTADADTKQWRQNTAREPREEGRVGGTGLAVEEDRELPVQCQHSPSHTNRTLDSPKNMARSLQQVSRLRGKLCGSPGDGDTVTQVPEIALWVDSF